MTPAPANLHLCTALLEQSAFRTRRKYKIVEHTIIIYSDYFNFYNELLVREFRFFKFKEISYLRSESHVKAGSLLMVLVL